MAPPPDASLENLDQERQRNPYFKHLLLGHTNSVRAIAGDATTLISGSYDCTVRQWDLSTGTNTFVFRGHREKVYSVGYSEKLDRCVSGSMDSTVRIWCTKTGVSLHVLDGHTSLVGLLELSERFLVSAAADATLRIWDPITGACLANLLGHPAAITCFHHDPVLNRIVSGSDGGIKVWEMSSYGYGIPEHHAPPIPSGSQLANQLLVSQTPTGTQPLYGRHVANLLSSIQGVWRVRMDRNKIVCACQRESGTWFEILDFSSAEGGHVNAAGDGDFEDEDDDEMMMVV